MGSPVCLGTPSSLLCFPCYKSLHILTAPGIDVLMKVIIRLTPDEEAKALPILLRHSPGMVLLNATYVLNDDVLKNLRSAGIRFFEVDSESITPSPLEVAGERV